ncbi:hypothetical protein Phum_PHUM569080 [Pediculus humanus corporis]|uniref:Uncharacterized protein n=1 Tax=Pediculus humanus subsp. corporis TaxID=121224 RepID=E0W130_PEDHC|nr:uncharacterized protein Phum_PHUM569080 [Pediculus humanus corporis]EEB19336.1 hypothetical protein Phum_PHUM569080 [Pediculus humanus corporis]
MLFFAEYSKYLLKLQVINLLLEAERRKLCVLQRELKTALEEGGSIKAKEHQKQELITAIQKIQSQYDNLEKECRQHAIGALKASNTRGIGKFNITTSRLNTVFDRHLS